MGITNCGLVSGGDRLRIGQGLDVVLDLLLLPVASRPEVVVGLQPGPQFGRGSEAAGQPESGVGGDAALLEDDLVDAARGQVQGPRQGVLGKAARLEEFLLEDIARVDLTKLGPYQIRQW